MLKLKFIKTIAIICFCLSAQIPLAEAKEISRRPVVHQAAQRYSESQARHHWRVKYSGRFEVYYVDKYIDVDKIFQEMCAELKIHLNVNGTKIKVFIGNGYAYAQPGAFRIVVSNEKQLRHELAHLLFCQINKNAPLILQEAVAIYAENPEAVRQEDLEFSQIAETAKAQSRAVKAFGYSENQQYRACAGWVKGIVEKEGLEKFKEFFRSADHSHNLCRAYERVYQK
jgi:hypothetical protein